LVSAQKNAGSGAAALDGQGPRPIWLCADDYGISPSVNIAIRDLVVRERLNATSVLVAAPSFHRSEAFALDALNTSARRVSIGLHLTLTAPFRPLSKGFKGTREARFPKLAALLRLALMHRFAHRQLTAEITSQMEAFIDVFGRAPDFIDGHQHVHLFPQISEALLEVVKTTAPNAWLRQCGRIIPMRARFEDRKGLLLDILSYRLRRRSAALGLRTNPAFAGTYRFDEGADFAALFPRFLERLPAGSVVMCHPGFVDDELRRLDPLTTLREREYANLMSADFAAVLAANGLALA
jgi:predicted glycoside hydrolase/deacetylase ChbG (UPF0249 family)